MLKYLLIIFIPFSLIIANDSKPIKFGIILGGNYIQNDTKLPIIDGDTCCGEFNDGTATGFYTGLSLNYEFIPSLISGDVRLFFDSRPATLTANTNDYEVYNQNSDEYEFATIQNDFEATLNYFVFDIGTIIKPIESIPIAFRLGFDISDASITKTYRQSRQIIEPSGILINGKNSELVSEGNFDNLAMSQGISGSIISDFNVSEVITISPELSYRYPLNSSLEGIDWFTTLIRAGATISVRLNAPEKIEPKIEELDTTEIEEETLIVEDKTEEIIPENIIKGLKIENLQLTQTVVTQTYPILPYIFYDSASSKLNNKYYYKGDTGNFSEQHLDKNSLKIYERLLDIIGNRLSKSNNSITIMGYTDGKEFESMMERKSLAYSRANSIKDYLENKWDIPGDRMKIETADIPQQPTSTLYKEGFEENRRVEIIPEDISLLQPIIHSQFLEYTSDKKNISINIDANLEEIEDYTLILSDGNEQYYSESKLNSPTSNIAIELSNELQNKLANSDLSELKVELMITKEGGRRESKKVPFNVNKENNDFELGRLNLIVFDFDKSVISEPNKNMIDKFIINNISKDSQIDVLGSTDLLGEKIYNKELSQKRADNVASYINTLLPDVKFNKVVGVGSNNPKFDNTKPEGRFYCRTVLIEVKTLINID